MFWLGLGVGIVAGAMFGFVVVAFMNASSERDRMEEIEK